MDGSATGQKKLKMDLLPVAFGFIASGGSFD